MNGKTAKFYCSKPGDINVNLLHEIPLAPRTGITNINNLRFDWNILKTSQKDIQEKAEHDNQSLNIPKKGYTVDEISNNVESQLALLVDGQENDFSITSDKEEPSTANAEVQFLQEKVENKEFKQFNENSEIDEKEDISFKFVEQDDTVENDSLNYKKTIENDNIHEDETNLSENLDKDEDDENKASINNIVEYASERTVQCENNISSKNVLENELQEKSKDDIVQDTNIEDHITSNDTENTEKTITQKKILSESKLTYDETNLRKEIDEIIKKEHLDEIANLILEGHGELLVNATSKNNHVQEFITQLPIYLKKIELIHYCCEIGNIDELRKHLDRRKFALARENKTMLYLTPLHVAVIYNRRTVVRYLAGRFPETFKAVDKLGRTPLHFASIHPDGKFVYNMLLTLGADKNIKDNDGYTAEFYYESWNVERYNQLLRMLNKSKNTGSSGVTNLPQLDEITNLNRLENEYLTSVLGEVLKTGLSAIIHIRPPKPIKFLADYLYNYKEETTIKQDVENVGETVEQTSPPTPRPQSNVKEETTEHVDVSGMNYQGALKNRFQPLSRDQYGQTVIHFAAAREHGRNGLLQMLLELNGNIAYRDELYRTPRDIAALSELYDNVRAIDEYMLHIAANGNTEKIIQLIIDGYDHILDTETNQNIIDIVTNRNHNQTLAILHRIPRLEKTREKLHSAIRCGDMVNVMEIFKKCGKDAESMAICRNDMFRCSLHVSVLTQQKNIVKYVVKRFPQTLHIGDNLERTPLHYAMALESVEEFTTILIRAGAKRMIKDLKGRQPSYYFMNKSEIIQMQREEMYLNNEPDRGQLRKTR